MGSRDLQFFSQTELDIDLVSNETPISQQQLPVAIDDELEILISLPNEIFPWNMESSLDCMETNDMQKLLANFASLDELKEAIRVPLKNVQKMCMDSIGCVGCRRSFDDTINFMLTNNYPTVEPLRIVDNEFVTINELVLKKPGKMCRFFRGGSITRLDILFGNQKRNKRNQLQRCILHSIDIRQHHTLLPVWKTAWDEMSTKCKEQVTKINTDSVQTKLIEHQKRNRFCAECRQNMERAFNKIIGNNSGSATGSNSTAAAAASAAAAATGPETSTSGTSSGNVTQQPQPQPHHHQKQQQQLQPQQPCGSVAGTSSNSSCSIGVRNQESLASLTTTTTSITTTTLASAQATLTTTTTTTTTTTLTALTKDRLCDRDRKPADGITRIQKRVYVSGKDIIVDDFVEELIGEVIEAEVEAELVHDRNAIVVSEDDDDDDDDEDDDEDDDDDVDDDDDDLDDCDDEDDDDDDCDDDDDDDSDDGDLVGDNEQVVRVQAPPQQSHKQQQQSSDVLLDKQIRISPKTDYVAKLISKVEPQLHFKYRSCFNKREKHTKSAETANDEILACVGMCIYDRLYKIFLRSREKLNSYRIFLFAAVDLLYRQLEIEAQKKKQGKTNLELYCEQLDRRKERRKRRQKSQRNPQPAQAQSQSTASGSTTQTARSQNTATAAASSVATLSSLSSSSSTTAAVNGSGGGGGGNAQQQKNAANKKNQSTNQKYISELSYETDNEDSDVKTAEKLCRKSAYYLSDSIESNSESGLESQLEDEDDEEEDEDEDEDEEVEGEDDDNDEDVEEGDEEEEEEEIVSKSANDTNSDTETEEIETGSLNIDSNTITAATPPTHQHNHHHHQQQQQHHQHHQHQQHQQQQQKSNTETVMKLDNFHDNQTTNNSQTNKTSAPTSVAATAAAANAPHKKSTNASSAAATTTAAVQSLKDNYKIPDEILRYHKENREQIKKQIEANRYEVLMNFNRFLARTIRQGGYLRQYTTTAAKRSSGTNGSTTNINNNGGSNAGAGAGARRPL